MKHDKSKAEKEIDELLGLIKKKTGLNQEQIAEKIGYNRSYLSQAKKTDSNKLYMALSNEFRAVLENITLEEPAKEYLPDASRERLEQTLVNLSEDKIRSTAIIEKLVALLDRSISLNKSSTGSPSSHEGAVNTVAAENKLRRTGRTEAFSLNKKDKQQGSEDEKDR